MDAERKQRKNATKKDAGDDTDCGWWYEVMVQKEKPAEDAAGLEIKFDGGPKGKWWITGFAVTDKETHDAMSGVDTAGPSRSHARGSPSYAQNTAVAPHHTAPLPGALSARGPRRATPTRLQAASCVGHRHISGAEAATLVRA